MQEKIIIIRGDTPQLTFVMSDEDGLPIDLTNIQVSFTGRLVSQSTDGSDTTAQISKLISNQGDPTTGVVTFQLTTTDTAKVGNYHRDMQLKYPDGMISSCERGSMEIMQDVTKYT